MAIKIVSGVPGSGKSYYAVNHCVTKHYDWDDNLDEYKPKHPILLITNIDDLRLPHWSLDTILENYNVSLEEFFTVPFMEKLAEDYPEHRVVIMLDEVQRHFPAGYRNTDVLYYFQWHRHLGHDIYLMCQTVESVCKHIVALIEFEIKAVRDSLKAGNYFVYNFMAGDLQVGDKKLFHDKKIFGLYTSFKAEDKGEKLNPLRKVIIRTVLVLVVALVCCFFAYKGIMRGIGGSNVSADTGQSHPQRGQKTPPQQKSGFLPGGRSGSARQGDTGLTALEEKKSVVPVRSFHPVGCGGMWVGRKLIAVQLFGEMVPIGKLAYTWNADFDARIVTVYVPGEVLAQVQPLYQAGASDLYRDGTGKLTPVGAGSGSVTEEDPVSWKQKKIPEMPCFVTRSEANLRTEHHLFEGCRLRGRHPLFQGEK